MWEWIKALLTTQSAEWYETLPFFVGFLFVIIELVVRAARRRRFSAAALGYMLSEGITVCIVPIYGLALAFDRTLAADIADKNNKVLAVAMFVAFATLMIHIFDGWFQAVIRARQMGRLTIRSPVLASQSGRRRASIRDILPDT